MRRSVSGEPQQPRLLEIEFGLDPVQGRVVDLALAMQAQQLLPRRADGAERHLEMRPANLLERLALLVIAPIDMDPPPVFLDQLGMDLVSVRVDAFPAQQGERSLIDLPPRLMVAEMDT